MKDCTRIDLNVKHIKEGVEISNLVYPFELPYSFDNIGNIIHSVYGVFFPKTDDSEISKGQIMSALSESIKQKKVPESIVLNHVLLMSQQSLCPDTYDMFLKAYNELIDIRNLPLEKL